MVQHRMTGGRKEKKEKKVGWREREGCGKMLISISGATKLQKATGLAGFYSRLREKFNASLHLGKGILRPCRTAHGYGEILPIGYEKIPEGHVFW